MMENDNFWRFIDVLSEKMDESVDRNCAEGSVPDIGFLLEWSGGFEDEADE